MIPRAKFGRPSIYAEQIQRVIDGELPYLTFVTRSPADTCATYCRTHFTVKDCGVRKETSTEFRVYIDTGKKKKAGVK